jgi:hypothetical protein
MNCGGRLCKGETKCFTCEMPVSQGKTKREINLERARLALTIIFMLCFGLTIASLFTDVGPSFYKCAAATVILHFVRTSAVEMASSKDS